MCSDENDPPGELSWEIHERPRQGSPPSLGILPSLKGDSHGSHAYARRNGYQQPAAPLQFAPDFDIFLMEKSSTNATAWFLLRSFDDLCTKSFLMSAILLYNFETLTLAFFQ